MRKDLAVQFYGANRPGAKVSQHQGLLETDFTEELKKIDVPTSGKQLMPTDA